MYTEYSKSTLPGYGRRIPFHCPSLQASINLPVLRCLERRYWIIGSRSYLGACERRWIQLDQP